MIDLPQKALSVRQPWAWAICHAGKHLENRSWRGPQGYLHAMRNFRGPVCIHASTGMTRAEYESAHDFMARNGVACPAPINLVRGAIIGTAVVVEWITRSHSFWFMGPGALRLESMTSLQSPIPCSGALGFFEWKEGGEFSRPAKWMLPARDSAVEITTQDTQGVLL